MHASDLTCLYVCCYAIVFAGERVFTRLCECDTQARTHTQWVCIHDFFVCFGFLSIFFHACVRRFASHSLSLAPLSPSLSAKMWWRGLVLAHAHKHTHTHTSIHMHTHTHSQGSLSRSRSLLTHTLSISRSFLRARSLSFFQDSGEGA